MPGFCFGFFGPSSGTVDPLGRAVKGAVDEFAARLCLEVQGSVGSLEGRTPNGWESWIIRKPHAHVPEPVRVGIDIDVASGGEYRPGAKPLDTACETRIEHVWS